MNSSHVASNLTASYEGTTAQIFALDTRSNEIVIIKQGEAEFLREVTREFFRCPVEDCGDPRLISVGGKSSRRHHFRHRSHTEHEFERESYLHYVSKHIISDWAKNSANKSGLQISAEVDKIYLGRKTDRKRKPDVFIKSTSSENQLAFEIEFFNSTTLQNLSERHCDLNFFGVKDIWIVGYPSNHVRIKNQAGENRASLKLNEFIQAISQFNQPLFVIDPINRLIGTAIVEIPPQGDSWWKTPEFFGSMFSPLTQNAEIIFDSLDDCEFDLALGILTPTMELVLASQREIKKLAFLARQKFETELAGKTFYKQESLESQQSSKRIQIDFESFLSENGADTKRELYAIHFSKNPRIFSIKQSFDDAILAPREKWHLEIYLNFIANRKVGELISLREITRYFDRQGISCSGTVHYRDVAISSYLHFLRSIGLISFNDERVPTICPIKIVENQLPEKLY